jgi:hypothetical protein
VINDEEKFISGIHNYCDRWCERCAFTARCRVADAESGLTDAERDIENEVFWRNLANIFAEAKTTILEKAEELDIEFEPLSDEEFTEYRRREDAFIRNQDLTKLAEKYWKNARKMLEAKDDWLIFAALDEEELNNLQSDANGSIKIALIAVTRSIMAWTNLMTDKNSKTIAPYISLLKTIKQKADTKFPNAKYFMRPGFDEIEIVM